MAYYYRNYRPRNGNGRSGFTVLNQTGTVPTYREDEDVVVQVVKVALRDGSESMRVEARIVIDTPEYHGPAKGRALVFDCVEDVDNLIHALVDARDAFEQHGKLERKTNGTTRRQPPAKAQPAPAKAEPVKPTVRKRQPTTAAKTTTRRTR